MISTFLRVEEIGDYCCDQRNAVLWLLLCQCSDRHGKFQDESNCEVPSPLRTHGFWVIHVALFGDNGGGLQPVSDSRTSTWRPTVRAGGSISICASCDGAK